MHTLRTSLAVIVLAILTGPAFGQQAASGPLAKKPDPSRLAIDRIYASSEFASQSASANWLPDGSGYTTLERVANSTAREIVRHAPDSNEKSVLVSIDQLTPDLETGSGR